MALFLIHRRLVLNACEAVWKPINFPAVFQPHTFVVKVRECYNAELPKLLVPGASATAVPYRS